MRIELNKQPILDRQNQTEIPPQPALENYLGVKSYDIIDLEKQDKKNIDYPELNKVFQDDGNFLFYNAQNQSYLIYRENGKLKYFLAHDFIASDEEMNSLIDLTKKLQENGWNYQNTNASLATKELRKILEPNREPTVRIKPIDLEEEPPQTVTIQ